MVQYNSYCHTQKKPKRSYTVIYRENQYTMIITLLYSWFSSQWHVVLTNVSFAILIIHFLQNLWYVWFRRSVMFVYKRLIAEIKHLPSYYSTKYWYYARGCQSTDGLLPGNFRESIYKLLQIGRKGAFHGMLNWSHKISWKKLLRVTVNNYYED